MKELKITKDRVIKASESCPDAKTVLKELFPEAFKEEWHDITDLIKWRAGQMSSGWWLYGDYENPEGKTLVNITGEEIIFAWSELDKNPDYKIELLNAGTSRRKFRILKKR